MAVKWWLNCRKPSVAYSTNTLHSIATGQPTKAISSR